MSSNKCMALSAKLNQIPGLEHVLNVWKGFKTMATEPKIQRVLKRIGTHNGVFHCDEALACFMLKQLPEYKDAEIIRTRDQKILDTCDVVVDVGSIYEPIKKRFDHHQRGFDHTFSSILPHMAKNKQIKLSSAGLIYVHYGLEVINEILKEKNFIGDSESMKKIFLNVYEEFVEELDAIDNGIPMYAEGYPRYKIKTHLSARVHKLNPEWNTKNVEDIDKLFMKAVKLVGGEFTETVVESATVWWPARVVVENAILKRKNVYKTGEVIELGERCPWKDHLLSLEEEMGIVGEIKFVIFHDSTNSYRVQAIPLQPDSFICRVFLHKSWRGIRDEILSEVSGIKGTIFCHASGFIGGNQTRDGALQMAIKTLQAPASDRE